MAHFLRKKSIFKGGSKRTPPCTQVLKNLPGPIGLIHSFRGTEEEYIFPQFYSQQQHLTEFCFNNLFFQCKKRNWNSSHNAVLTFFRFMQRSFWKCLLDYWNSLKHTLWSNMKVGGSPCRSPSTLRIALREPLLYCCCCTILSNRPTVTACATSPRHLSYAHRNWAWCCC